jgi:hypothetical protein
VREPISQNIILCNQTQYKEIRDTNIGKYIRNNIGWIGDYDLLQELIKEHNTIYIILEHSIFTIEQLKTFYDVLLSKNIIHILLKNNNFEYIKEFMSIFGCNNRSKIIKQIINYGSIHVLNYFYDDISRTFISSDDKLLISSVEMLEWFTQRGLSNNLNKSVIFSNNLDIYKAYHYDNIQKDIILSIELGSNHIFEYLMTNYEQTKNEFTYKKILSEDQLGMFIYYIKNTNCTIKPRKMFTSFNILTYLLTDLKMTLGQYDINRLYKYGSEEVITLLYNLKLEPDYVSLLKIVTNTLHTHTFESCVRICMKRNITFNFTETRYYECRMEYMPDILIKLKWQFTLNQLNNILNILSRHQIVDIIKNNQLTNDVYEKYEMFELIKLGLMKKNELNISK